MTVFPYTPEVLRAALAEQDYFIDLETCRKLVLYLSLDKPIGLRGEPGVGKSELAGRMANLLQIPLVDIECHSQLEASDIGISWNAFRQLMDVQTGDAGNGKRDPYTLEYLNHTPLLQSLLSDTPIVVRVDEVDKLNETTSNFFLRYLDKRELIVHDLTSDNKTLRAKSPVYVFLTSNDYRELDPAFMRRVAWLDLSFPQEDELASLLQKRLELPEATAKRLSYIVMRLRELPLKKKPSIGEVLEWARGLLLVSDGRLSLDSLQLTIGLLLKYPQDQEQGWKEISSWVS